MSHFVIKLHTRLYQVSALHQSVRLWVSALVHRVVRHEGRPAVHTAQEIPGLDTLSRSLLMLPCAASKHSQNTARAALHKTHKVNALLTILENNMTTE